MNKKCVVGTYGTMYYVQNMKKSVEFFKTHFDLKPVFESDDWTEFVIGSGPNLCLHSAGNEKVNPNGVLIMSVKDIKGWQQKLKNDGVEFLSDIKEVHPGAYCLDFVDLDGNHLSLYENTTV